MSEWKPDIARLQRLDDAEWLAVQSTYCGRLLALAQRRTGDLQASEDIVQETLLGAVRGIHGFDPRYSFEQYLFGICRNRTVDALRRRKLRAIDAPAGEDGPTLLDQLESEEDSPSAIVRRTDLAERARALAADLLRVWVEETWALGEFQRLCVLEALFSGGWRNRDAWRFFELRDETAVAGIKFRAIRRLGELAQQRAGGGDLLAALGQAAQDEQGMLDLDLAVLWRKERVSCPSRHWLARLVAGTLEAGPAQFVRFHLDSMRCAWCNANRDDLARAEGGLDPLLQRVQASTLHYLRSRPVAGGGAPPARGPAPG